jgi:hypothetical protein
VLAAGGPLVININPLLDARAEKQMSSRVARKGQPGCGCGIYQRDEIISRVFKCKALPLSNAGLAQLWRIKRDQNVESQIKKLEQKQLPTVMLRGNE